jgi:hypothetical protein
MGKVFDFILASATGAANVKPPIIPLLNQLLLLANHSPDFCLNDFFSGSKS